MFSPPDGCGGCDRLCLCKLNAKKKKKTEHFLHYDKCGSTGGEVSALQEKQQLEKRLNIARLSQGKVSTCF